MQRFRKTLVISGLFWVIWLGVIFFYSAPKNLQSAIPLQFLVFFSPLFLALFFLLAALFQNTRRGLITTCVFIGALLLQIFRVLNLFNGLLLLGAGILLEMYFGNGKEARGENKELSSKN